MITDASSFENGARIEADLCIVGAGAAGIAMALKLAHSGLLVLLLEGGGTREEAPGQALYAGTIAEGSLHPPPERYRRRMLGGSTTLWGGRCVPLDPIDFERRAWIASSGWPITFETMLPFYAEANRLCEAGAFAYTAALAFPEGMRAMLPGFRSRDFTDDTLERFSCPTDFGRRYRARLAASHSVRLVLHANVTELRLDPQGTRVEAVEAVGPGGKRLAVQARCVVLAAGGLETVRILLASQGHAARGIGNERDLVGRTYMSHLAGTIGRFRPGALPVFHGYQLSADGIYCRRRLSLNAHAQRRLRTGGFIARLHHPPIHDASHRSGPLSALYLAAPLIRPEYRVRLAARGGHRLAHAGNVLRDAPATARFLAHWAWRRTLAARKYPSVIVAPSTGAYCIAPSTGAYCIAPSTGAYCIDFHAEQVPNSQSRVTLGGARDALGMRRLVVDWRSTAQDLHTVREALRSLRDALTDSGCGTLHYAEEEVEIEALRHGAYGGHHLGTARMAADPADGVVDAECRVHGIENLYVASSAVFPTSGQANPTLTIVALALRLALHLQARLAKSAAAPPQVRNASARLARRN